METILPEEPLIPDIWGSLAPPTPDHILVADDDFFNRTLLAKRLRKVGYEVTEVANGSDCLAAYEHKQPNLVLLDVMMPDMSGFDCCTELLKHPFSRHTPILMITSLEDQTSVDQAFAAGAIDFITKPVQWPVLRHRIRLILENIHLQKSLEGANLQLTRLATIDPLTDLANRRIFTACLKKEWRRLARERLPLSLLMLDVDCFKSYNDTYGHQTGDHCLRQIAHALKKSAETSPGNLVARYGGEEFSIVLPGTPLVSAVAIAEAMLQAVQALSIPHQKSTVSQYVSISLGAAAMLPSDQVSYEKLIAAADAALYRAKQAGRNQVMS
jgi:diguanylate cyclase (GGDEF)-like protein